MSHQKSFRALGTSEPVAVALEKHPAEELFTGAMREAVMFDDLLRKVGGDRSVVERLIEYERGQSPGATRLTCLQNAIERWEKENR